MYKPNYYLSRNKVCNKLSIDINWLEHVLYQRRVNIRLCLFHKNVIELVTIPTETYIAT